MVGGERVIYRCACCNNRVILPFTVDKEHVFCSKNCLVNYLGLMPAVEIEEGIPLLPHFNFRSKWEEKFAHFCEEHALKWKYEPKAFKLKIGKWYIPDFWVEGHYVEIKGIWERGAKKKAKAFKKQFGNLIILDKIMLKKIGVI